MAYLARPLFPCHESQPARLGLHGIAKGDNLVTLLGSQQCSTLRYVAERGCLLFMGEAYINGLADGEVYDMF